MEELIQIVDAVMAEAIRKSGGWVVCRPGCISCCIGPFPISPLDARRLRHALDELKLSDPDRELRIRERARKSVERIVSEFAEDPVGQVLTEDEAVEDEPCPVLDPATGTCDLYTARPITCRTFGPAVRCPDGSVGACELCYRGASDEEIAACSVVIDPEAIDDCDADRQTIVAFALAD
jgi:Fe-S-cluster containining protein